MTRTPQRLSSTEFRLLSPYIVNGVAIAAASQLLDGANDPTHGMLFTWALIMTQPEMSKRITMLAGDLSDAARRRVQTSATAAAASG